MQVKCTAKLAAMRHFRSKPEKGGKDYYVLEVLQLSERQDENFQGYESVSVFTDEGHYNALLNTFKPLMEVNLIARLNGTKVSYFLE